MTEPGQQRMEWDPVPIGDTKPAMKAGVPFWAFLGVPFLGVGLTALTLNVLWILWIPVALILSRLALLGNPNRPREWWLYVTSGAYFADWTVWGGATDDPHGGGDTEAGLG